MTNTRATRHTQAFEDLLESMRAKLHRLIPDVEIQAKAQLAFRINRLKREPTPSSDATWNPPCIARCRTTSAIRSSCRGYRAIRRVSCVLRRQFMAKPPRSLIEPDGAAAEPRSGLFTAEHRPTMCGPQVPGRARRELRQHPRRNQGRLRLLLHLGKCRCGGAISSQQGSQTHHLRAGRVPRAQHRPELGLAFIRAGFPAREGVARRYARDRLGRALHAWLFEANTSTP